VKSQKRSLQIKMRRFFENKLAVAAILSLFLLASAWNVISGAAPTAGPVLLPQDVVTIAHGPLLPPDPWDMGSVKVA
jgi:hypothetical protein